MSTYDGPPDAFGSAYRLLSTAVTPRPIGWISTRSQEGVDNLAPYSFFNVAAVDPPVVMFAPIGSEGLKDTPRVAAAPVALECELHDWVEVGGSVLVLGEVVYAHVDEGVLTDGQVDIEQLDTVGRLAGSQYASTAGRFGIDRPS